MPKMVQVYVCPDRDIVCDENMSLADALFVINAMGDELERQRLNVQAEREMWRDFRASRR